MSALVQATEGDAALGQDGLEAFNERAFGEPKAGGIAEAPAMRAQGGVDLQSASRLGRELGQDGVGGRRRHQGDAALLLRLLEGAERAAVQLPQAPDRSRVVVGL